MRFFFLVRARITVERLALITLRDRVISGSDATFLLWTDEGPHQARDALPKIILEHAETFGGRGASILLADWPGVRQVREQVTSPLVEFLQSSRREPMLYTLIYSESSRPVGSVYTYTAALCSAADYFLIWSIGMLHEK